MIAIAWNGMDRRRLLLIIIVLVLVVAAGATGWALFFRAIDVQVSQPERDVMVQVFGLGTVEARVTSKVGFKASGVLVDLRADVGDRVPKGAVLARLDDREQTARVGRAKAATEQADANLQRAIAKRSKGSSEPTPMPRPLMSASKSWFKAKAPQSRRQGRQKRRKTPRSRM